MKIEDFFELNSEVAIAFSGGVDSAVLLLLAKRYAKRVKAYYVKSQFQPQFELEDAKEISALLNAEIEIIELNVLEDAAITANPANRCYFCKRKIFGTIIEHAKKDGFATVLDGTNASDDIADRPGFAALMELEVKSPLKACGYTKADIRKIAAENFLPVADKPSYACLATRIPTGTEITAKLLEKTETAENLLRKAGFKNFRIRYNNGSARLEFGRADMKLFNDKKEQVFALLEPYYDGICLDEKERADE